VIQIDSIHMDEDLILVAAIGVHAKGVPNQRCLSRIVIAAIGLSAMPPAKVSWLPTLSFNKRSGKASCSRMHSQVV